MAYLVTGGSGYIGSYVVRNLLKAGKDVICFQRSGITPVLREIVGESDMNRVIFVQGDVSNTLQLFDMIREYGVDLIVHLGYSIPPRSEEQPAYALRTNCIGMNNILEAIRLFGLRRVVWTSSNLALGRIGQFYQSPIADDVAVYMPDSMYGATKVLNEFMAKLYFDKFGVDSIGLRLPLVFGIGRYHGTIGAFTEILKKAALNIPITMTNGNEFISSGYLYVEDAAALIATACNVPITKTRVFNAMEGNYTNFQLAEIIRKVNPDALVNFEEKENIRNFQPPNLNYSKVQIELGWQPKYSIEEGIRKVFNYFRQKEGMPSL